MDERVELVRDGYDAMAVRFGEWADATDDPARRRFVADLLGRLEPGSHIVDLGCGAGVPTAAQLAEQHDVLGVDVSRAQLALARRNVPDARFVEADLTTLVRPAGRADAVVALYSLTHVPREGLAELLERIARWLRPGGWLMATLSTSDDPGGVQAEFVGVPMFFSGFDVDSNRRLVDAAGFVRVVDEVVTLDEPEGPARFHWVLAQRSGPATDTVERCHYASVLSC